MAWQKILGNVKSLDYDFQCLSTDAKPTIGMEVGAKAYELDTGAGYKYNGSAWVAIISGGNLSGAPKRPSATVIIGTGAAHSAGDVVSTDAGAIMEFETGLPAGSSGFIFGAYTYISTGTVFAGGAGYNIRLFDAAPTALATNAAFTIIAADRDKSLGFATISALVKKGDTCEAHDLFAPPIPFTLAAGDTKLYAQDVCLGGETTVSGVVIIHKLSIAAI